MPSRMFVKISPSVAPYFHSASVKLGGWTSFGACGEGYLRLSYANSYENIERALERIKAALAARAGVATA